MALTGVEPLEVSAREATVTGFRCSQCGSEDIQKLSLVYEGGTSVINARTAGSSTGIGVARGGIGLGTSFNSARTRGTQVSELAKRAAPPPAKLAFGWLLIGLIGFLLLWSFSAPVGALVVAGLCGFLAYKGISYNGGERAKLLDVWRQSWLCHRCGTIFTIEQR